MQTTNQLLQRRFLQLIKKLQPQPDTKPKQKKKKRKGSLPVAEVLRRKAALAAGETLSSSESEESSSDDDDMSSSEAESLLAEDPSYRLPPRDPPPPRYKPFIDTIFGGKLASVIVCEECRGVSRIEEDFLDISLPIKGDDGKVRRVSTVACSSLCSSLSTPTNCSAIVYSSFLGLVVTLARSPSDRDWRRVPQPTFLIRPTLKCRILKMAELPLR